VVDTLFTLSVAHMVYTHPLRGGGPSPLCIMRIMCV